MTTPALRASRSESTLLWATWQQYGAAALDRGEYATAITWLSESLAHLQQGGPSDLSHAVTQAHLALAHFRMSLEHEVCAADACLSREHRRRARKRAVRSRTLANNCAQSALPRLRASSADDVRLARGRAAFVLAKCHFGNAEYGAAASCFNVARDAIAQLGSQSALLTEVLKGLFAANDGAGNYEAALEDLLHLEPVLASDPLRLEELAWLVASRAQMYIYRGQYREADSSYSRWTFLVGQLDSEGQGSDHAAFGHAVFGRTRLALGYYDDAETQLCRSRTLTLNKAKRHAALLVDVATALGDLAERRGQFACAQQLLRDADERIHFTEKQHGRRLPAARWRWTMASARRWLSLGQFVEACECFTAARSLAEQELGCKYFFFVPPILGLARIESERGAHAAALDLVHCAILALQQAGAMESAEMAATWHELAHAYVQADKSDEAEPACRNAIQLLASALRANHPDEASMRLTLAQILSGKHRARAALDEVRRAGDNLRQHAPCRAFDRARAFRIEAEIELACRSGCCALGILNCARCIWHDEEKALAITHPERALITFDLAAVGKHLPDENLVARILADDDFDLWICRYKCDHERAGYELHRRANMLFEHGLYREAEWAYGKAVEQYTIACGSDHPSTRAAFKHQATAQRRRDEPGLPEVCPCYPGYVPCGVVNDSPCHCPPVCSPS
jgi:tetratricopeptide (TPR) repeat protein